MFYGISNRKNISTNVLQNFTSNDLFNQCSAEFHIGGTFTSIICRILYRTKINFLQNFTSAHQTNILINVLQNFTSNEYLNQWCEEFYTERTFSTINVLQFTSNEHQCSAEFHIEQTFKPMFCRISHRTNIFIN
jgi:hypothetical protein